MKSFYLHVFYFLIINFLLSHQLVQGQANKVSSKLDFDENTDNQNANNSNTNVPMMTGTGQGSNDGQGGTGRGINTGGIVNSNTATGDSGGGTGSSSGKGPKIHGVRVTVDTGDGQKSKESKESVEITDLGKHKKRVGIHTDITFEISTDGEGNETSSAQHGDKEDASVPFYKGRDRSDTKHKSHKPYDPKSQWNPTDRRGGDSYGGGRHGGGYDEIYGGGSGATGSGSYYPHTQQYYPQHTVPIYTSGSSSDTGTIYRSDDGWSHYIPVWTTERAPSEQSQLYRRPSWKPCYCMSSYGSDYRRRRASIHGVNKKPKMHILRPTSPVIQIVDGKLERPFS